jgi:hypothetical protein
MGLSNSGPSNILLSLVFHLDRYDVEAAKGWKEEALMAKPSPKKDLLPCLAERTEAVETVKPLPSNKYFQRIRIPPAALDRAGLRSQVHLLAAVGGSQFRIGTLTRHPPVDHPLLPTRSRLGIGDQLIEGFHFHQHAGHIDTIFAQSLKACNSANLLDNSESGPSNNIPFLWALPRSSLPS